MVNLNRGNSLSQGDFFPSRDNWGSRIEIPQESRIPSAPLHGYPQPIESALRDCAQIPVREFALVVILENGEEKTYSSTSLKPYRPRIFTERFRRDFRQCVRRAGVEGSCPSSAYSQEGMYGEFDEPDIRKHSSSGGESSSDMARIRRQRQTRSEDSSEEVTIGKRKRVEEDNPVPTGPQLEALEIGNSTEVEKFYHVRFKDMQQSSCKVMGKAFVKLVEPKKQTHHPYTKGNEKKPPWWPNTSGENSVRHKEPDHLLKPERIRLLVHILRMIIEPRERQCPTVQKLGLNVRKLEEVTMEAMSNWFSDKEHPENAAKKPFLREIFKVARMEERFRAGEVDGTTEVYIMCGERMGRAEESDDEEEENEEPEKLGISTNLSNTPENLVSPTMLQHPYEPHYDPDTQGILQHRPRPPPITRHSGPTTHYEESPSFADPSYRSMSTNFQPHSTPIQQDPYRRPSYAPSPFPSPQQTMYSGPWQNTNIMSNSPIVPGYIVTSSPQSSMTPHTTSFQLPAPPAQQSIHPPRMSHFDGLPSSRQYDAGPASSNPMRHGSLGHPHPMHHGIGDFLHDPSFGHNEPAMKEDPHTRPS
ncbi:hypothetical protein G7Y89_g14217 [Cudoniella acicularis]|uniref:Subtelomeric hrmA-associated cluster protein AFUB-079030/YDR124W-like helical bundle domain-containing protein n=1 Tax=Cudoniella acicularis TaxID=354080 RepID=A0A8H4R4L3_9HELO|nr:hypothetical protein G7Y89_g14217 [Cudoniella acicularis]